MTRAISDPDNVDAEFAVLVRSDLKGLGLGRRLLEKLISYTRDHGLLRLNGITMPNNRGMVTLARKLGFDVDIQLDEGIVSLNFPLADTSRPGCIEKGTGKCCLLNWTGLVVSLSAYVVCMVQTTLQ